MSPEFLSLNPNNKIPAVLDPDGPGGKPLPLWESGAILLYLAEKTGRFLPDDAAGRYAAESRRLLNVLDQRLQDRDWVLGDAYTIADMAIFPWVNNLVGFYGAGALVEYGRFTLVQRTLAVFLARPAVVRGLHVPPHT